MQVTKINENKIKTTEQVNSEKVYSYDFLLRHKEDLLRRKLEINEEVDAELEKINILLEECTRLQLKTTDELEVKAEDIIINNE